MCLNHTQTDKMGASSLFEYKMSLIHSQKDKLVSLIIKHTYKMSLIHTQIYKMGFNMQNESHLYSNRKWVLFILKQKKSGTHSFLNKQIGSQSYMYSNRPFGSRSSSIFKYTKCVSTILKQKKWAFY